MGVKDSGPERPVAGYLSVTQVCIELGISKVLLKRARRESGVTGSTIATLRVFDAAEVARLREWLRLPRPHRPRRTFAERNGLASGAK